MDRETAPTLTDGNKLYLYDLLKRTIGCGKQTFLPRVEEALAESGLRSEDIGFENTRALMEALGDVVTLTVFKGGRAYATLAAQPAWDAMLDAPEEAKPAKGNKPWKRKKGAKLKPVRPKQVKRKAETEGDGAPEGGAATHGQLDEGRPTEVLPQDREQGAALQEETRQEVPPRAEAASQPEMAAQQEAVPQPGTARRADETTQREWMAAGSATQQEATPAGAISRQNTVPQVDVTRQREMASAETMPVNATGTSGNSQSNDTLLGNVASHDVDAQGNDDTPRGDESPTQPQPVAPERASTPESAPATAPAPKPEPTIALTVTYDPYTDQDEETVLTPSPAKNVTGGAGITEKTPSANKTPSSKTSPTPRANYPRDFVADVHAPGALLSRLARIMPLHADALAILTEDFRIARNLGTLRGTRAQATFPLRYTADGSRPVTVSIRRGSGGGAPWVIADIGNVSDEALAASGIDGLPVLDDSRPENPLRRFALQVRLDEDVITRLINLAHPAVWDAATIRVQLAFAWANAQEGCAEFASGLFDKDGHPIAVRPVLDAEGIFPQTLTLV